MTHQTNVPNIYIPNYSARPVSPKKAEPEEKPEVRTRTVITVQSVTEEVCLYRECDNALPEKSKRGPRKTYCSHTCRRRERHEREKDKGMHQTQGRPTENLKARKYEAGQSWNDLTLIQYVERSKAGESRGLFRCSCGNEKVLQVGAVTRGVTANCANRSVHPDPRSKGSAITYSGAHNRVRNERGPAKDYLCIFCTEQAYEWAYLHSDPEEKADDDGKEKGRPFSPEPRHYQPLCRSHHTRFDRGHDRLPLNGSQSLAHVVLATVLSSALDTE